MKLNPTLTRRLPLYLPAGLCALALASCAPSKSSVELDTPAVPSHVRAGGPIRIPRGDLDERHTAALLKALRKSELDGWRKRDQAARYADCTRKRDGAAVVSCLKNRRRK